MNAFIFRVLYIKTGEDKIMYCNICDPFHRMSTMLPYFV